jgi:hypothetical protein
MASIQGLFGSILLKKMPLKGQGLKQYDIFAIMSACQQTM